MYKKYILSVLCIFAIGYAMAQDQSQYMVGQWKVLKMDIPTMQVAISKASPAEKAQLKSELETLMKYSSFDFKSDGTYYIMMGGKEERGTWEGNAYGSKLFTRQKNADGTLSSPQQIGMQIINKRRVILLNEYDTGEIIKMELIKQR